MKILTAGVAIVLIFWGVLCDDKGIKTRSCRAKEFKYCIHTECKSEANFESCEMVLGQKNPNCSCKKRS